MPSFQRRFFSAPRLRTVSGCALLAVLMAAATAGHAQYVWLDEHNVKQYSDVPPPASVTQDRILKTPKAGQAATPVGIDSSAVTSKQPTVAEQEMDFRKRQQDQQDAAKKAQEDAKNAATKQKVCEQGRTAQKALDSGRRLDQPGPNGERIPVTPEARDKFSQDTKTALKACD